jgi:hypothetical protein
VEAVGDCFRGLFLGRCGWEVAALFNCCMISSARQSLKTRKFFFLVVKDILRIEVQERNLLVWIIVIGVVTEISNMM